MSTTITVTLDDVLWAHAQSVADPKLDQDALINEALKTFVHRQAARRLADLGGSLPTIQDIPRRREYPPQ